jgi:hypothetical protein
MAKDEFGDIYFFILVYFHGYTLAIVVNTDVSLLGIDLDLEKIHFFISLKVVSSIH